MLDVRRLQVLRAVARDGSLTAAARTLGYTQPAISHHIARLEAEVGTALLTRLGRGVQLTDAGSALVAHADAVVARLDAAEEELAAIAGLRAGRVRLASFPSASATLVAGALQRLRTEHPGIAVTLADAEPEEALPRLRAGEIDLVVGFSYAPHGGGDGRDVVTVPLLHDLSVAVLPADHPAAADPEPLDLGRLAGETWIAGCVRCRGHLLDATGAAGYAPDIGFATDDYVAVQSLVARGLGVSLLPALALAAVRRPDIAVRSVSGTSTRTVEAVLPLAERRPPAVHAMLAALADEAAALAETSPAARLGITAAARG